MIQLNFTNNENAQDMINIIMKDKNLSDKDAISFAINEKICNKIQKAGYASIAFNLWGHAEYEKEWLLLDNPVIEVELTAKQLQLINRIINIEKDPTLDINMAVSYFLIFTMDSMGYDI